MDVDSLRAELEEHLKKNPHEDAPDGFRDRFDTIAELLASGDDEFPKSVLEEQLQQIRVEAEAAWNAAALDPAPDIRVGASAPAPRLSGGDDDAAPPSSGAGDAASGAAPAAEAEPEPGFLQRYGIVLVLILVVLVAAFFYFR